jgi:FG-GAP repeat
LVFLASLCAAVSANAALPATYAPGPIDVSPSTAGAGLGASVVNAGDLDGDGQDDIVVGAPNFPVSSGISGRVTALRSNGAAIWPESVTAPSPQVSHAGADTSFGFRVARLGDVGRCQTTGDNCTVGPPDGRPEILVSAPGTDLGGAAGVDQGAVYVLDGATGRILKQINLPDIPATGSAGFGKSVASLSGQPPCQGFGGVGECAYAPGSAVAQGDVNGGGKPDLMIGAPNFAEADGVGGCPEFFTCSEVGRVYVFFGEGISGSSSSPLTEANGTILNPGQVGGENTHFGALVAPVGDLGKCYEGDPDPAAPDARCATTPLVQLTTTPDGKPDIVVSAPGADVGGVTDAGVAYVIDVSANRAMRTLQDPQPQEGDAFGAGDQSSPPAGDLGLDAAPDVLLGSTTGQGALFAFGGNVFSGGLVTALGDPSPVASGAFGAAAAGLGNVAGDRFGEVAVSASGGARPGAIHIVSPCASAVLQSVPDPAGQSGSGFGVAIAPIGDRNGDGIVDLVAGSAGYDGSAGADQGRIYVLTSTGQGAAYPDCGGGTGPGTGAGGGTQNPPVTNPPDGKVKGRAVRRLRLAVSRRRLYAYEIVKFKGSLRASANTATCQVRQKIALQRRKLRGGRFRTFDVAVTNRNGSFTLASRPDRSYIYRARVLRNRTCGGATSKRLRVVVHQ